MKTLTLTDDAVELLLMLLRVHRDEVETHLRGRHSIQRTGITGRVPSPGDARDAGELQLTGRLILMLEQE
jgi:hypothetical protein